MAVTHYVAHAGSGTCDLCGKHSDDLVAVTRDGSLKRLRICEDCKRKVHANDADTVNRIGRMLS